MNLDDIAKLKFDRRLEHRRDWLAPGEREAFIEGLADAEPKMHDGTEEEVPAQATEAPAAPDAAPQTAAPAPPAAPATEGGFGGSNA